MSGHAGARAVRRLRIVGLDLWRTFFAEPVRANVIRARGGGFAAAVTVALGLVAFAVAALGVVYAARLGAAPVAEGGASLGKASRPGRPVGIPALAYPALAGLLLVAVFVGTFGAIYARRLVAGLAVALMWLPMLLLGGFAWSFRHGAWPAWIGLPASLLYPLAVLALRRRPPRPVLAQAAAAGLALVTVVPSVVGQTLAYTEPGSGGGPALLGASVEQIVTLLAGLVAPVAVLAGAGSVSFGRTVTDFLARSLRRLAGRRLWAYAAVLAALLLWRVGATLIHLAGADSPGRVLVKTALVGLLVGVAVRWWAWATRGFDESSDEVEQGAGVAATPVALLTVAFVFPPMIALVLASAEIALVFFGVVWGFLTSGAHTGATGLPGVGRAAVLLSYAVLTTTLIAWSYATGADAGGGLSSDFAAIGANMLGVALLLSFLAVWTPALLGARAAAAPPAAD